LHITHWTSHDLARQAVADGIVAAISPRTVRQILKGADVQPHRTRYWRTSRLDEQLTLSQRRLSLSGQFGGVERGLCWVARF
jgi:hypothetical protein